ncbi:hypothetical protein RhiirA4_485960 [Rhizophagus irregularis]|uniref:Uncharacterized protein n=1 Tax=Rhizophagus irregularis TaxID=588596 RepID=A0A2I1HR33_9GLOM|nr:hypothetical protein RhiirA4_485960 [Rhizophagus irregularis]
MENKSLKFNQEIELKTSSQKARYEQLYKKIKDFLEDVIFKNRTITEITAPEINESEEDGEEINVTINEIDDNSKNINKKINEVDENDNDDNVGSNSNNGKKRKSNKGKEVILENEKSLGNKILKNNSSEEVKRRHIQKEIKKKEKLEKFIEKLNRPVKEVESWKDQLLGIDNQNKEQLIEVDNQDKENGEIEKLVESYNELGSMNTRVIRKWYHFGRSFERQVEAMKNQGRKRKSEQTARKDLYDKMMKLLIGEEKINNVRETYVSTIIKFMESEIDEVFKGIKKKIK